MLTSYFIVAFICFIVPIVIFLIIFKRKSIEHDGVVKNFEQKIEELVAEQNCALNDAESRLKQQKKDLRDNQDKLIDAQEELKKFRIAV
ncbi:MAG: hypothetical protein D3924_10260 [Candidatus Electrothrix sp. AR4]|nr:hypothetical protein [Candidatus Electrothrix sp. AR4]